MDAVLRQIRGIADFQYGHGAGLLLFPDTVDFIYSKNTGRIRHIKFNDRLLASFRPNDGLLTLSIFGAERLVNKMPSFDYFVMVMDEISDFPSNGNDVFSKHVTEAGCKIKPSDEVVVVDSKYNVLAVGKALLNKNEMSSYMIGVAVKVRKGRNDRRQLFGGIE
jgi:predicted RNA-binding protein (TIGR00451 family)